MENLTKRIFESLPIERIRPEIRTVFIPDEKQNDFLVAAAKSRLEGLTDVPYGMTQTEYAEQKLIRRSLPTAPYCLHELVLCSVFTNKRDLDLALKIINNLGQGSQFCFIFGSEALRDTTFSFIEEEIRLCPAARRGWSEYKLLEYWDCLDSTSGVRHKVLIGELREGLPRPLLKKVDTAVAPQTGKKSMGQITNVAEFNTEVQLWLSRFEEDDVATEGVWIPTPDALPGWALDGTPFFVRLDKDIKGYDDLKKNPNCMSDFEHEIRPYLTDVELLAWFREDL